MKKTRWCLPEDEDGLNDICLDCKELRVDDLFHEFYCETKKCEHEKELKERSAMNGNAKCLR